MAFEGKTTFTFAGFITALKVWLVGHHCRPTLRLKMAHLPEGIVNQRRAQLQEEILQEWQDVMGESMYVVICPCDLPPCSHMPEANFPRLRVSRCHYPGELDFLMVEKPFLLNHGFEVTWLCLYSSHRCEFSCGSPSDHGGVPLPSSS